MKTRVLWHLPFAMIGGVETLYATILKYSDKDKFENFVTCHDAIADWVNDKFKRNAIVSTWSNAEQLADKISSIKPGVIMGTHGKALYEALDYTKNPCPVIEVVHGSHIWSEHNIYMPKTYTQHIVCVSKSAERVYLENIRDSKIETSVIINGIDTQVFHPMKALNPQPKTVGYIGRFMESDKHVKKIIKAFKSIGDHRARLHLIGGQPQEIVHLKHFARSLKMGSIVKIEGYTSRPEKYYKNIDIFTVRSEAEGYCNSVAEAMACGIPAVCYNFGGIIEHAPKGSIAVANDQKEYAKLLATVHRDFELRQRMRKLGLDFIQKEGNAQTMVKRYEQAILDVHNNKSVAIPEPVEIKYKTVSIQTSDGSAISVGEKRDNPIVGVCNPNWHGIATATKSICDVIVPWHRDPKIIVANIVREKPHAVLFSGMCPGFDKAIRQLNRQHKNMDIYGYYHGGVSHYSFKSGLFGQGEYNAFDSMIDLHRSGLLKKIAVSAPGLAEVMSKKGLNFEFCGNLLPKKNYIDEEVANGFHIGNWNRHHDHKHTSMGQAVATLTGATLHELRGGPVIPALGQDRVYNDMPQDLLHKKYAQMTVNLQLSFIETFNISVLEMWACGAPALVGAGNYVLVKDSPVLKKYCFVVDQTNPVEVANKCLLIKKNREMIVKAQYEHLDKLNKEVESRWGNFFL